LYLIFATHQIIAQIDISATDSNKATVTSSQREGGGLVRLDARHRRHLPPDKLASLPSLMGKYIPFSSRTQSIANFQTIRIIVSHRKHRFSIFSDKAPPHTISF